MARNWRNYTTHSQEDRTHIESSKLHGQVYYERQTGSAGAHTPNEPNIVYLKGILAIMQAYSSERICLENRLKSI